VVVLGYEEADRLAVGLLVVLVQIILRGPAIQKEIAGVDPPDIDGLGMLVLLHFRWAGSGQELPHPSP
jgi:hypothetical protein